MPAWRPHPPTDQGQQPSLEKEYQAALNEMAKARSSGLALLNMQTELRLAGLVDRSALSQRDQLQQSLSTGKASI